MPDDEHEDAVPRRSAPQVHMVRAGIVVGCFVVALIVLLGPASNLTASVAPSSSTTTTVPVPVVRAQTKVQVANGTTVKNAAGTTTSQLNVLGWDMLPAVDVTPVPTTATARPVTYVYFATGQQQAAQLVAQELGVSHAHVTIRTTATEAVVPGAASDDVIVILGKDIAH